MTRKRKPKRKERRVRKVAHKPEPAAHHYDPVLPEPDPRFMHIRERIRTIDPWKEWETIREWLNIAPAGIHEIRRELQRAADMEARSKDLHEEASIAKGNFDDQFRDRSQIWRKESLIYWEEEKIAGLHKQITESMIEDRIIELHSELYLELKKRKREINSMVNTMEAMLKNVINKRTDLRKMLESETRRPGATPGWMDGNQSNG